MLRPKNKADLSNNADENYTKLQNFIFSVLILRGLEY